MSGGGLPAIPVYEIERHWYLQELRNLRAFKRVHGLAPSKYAINLVRKALCKTRKEKYK